MKTLILSCNTGEGHNSCAKAIKDYFDACGEICTVEDGLSFISPAASDIMSRGHSYIYKHMPWLSRRGYNYAESHTAYYGESTPLYKYFTQGSARLSKYIAQSGFDCVICTHVFTAFMVTRMLEKCPMKLSTAFVATDYSSYPAIEKTCLDFYFVPDRSLIPVYANLNIPKEKIIAAGIPLRGMFYESKPNAEAKSACGIDPEHRHLLIMCGSMGCGPMEELLAEISGKIGENIEISVVCGNNSKLEATLSKQYSDFNNIHINGFVENMSLLMDGADLYLTKPGGISTSEAAGKRLPMVLIDAVAGVEKYNLKFFVESGGAVTASTPREVADLCIDLLHDRPLTDYMKQKLLNSTSSNASEAIYNELKKHYAQTRN